MSPNKWGPRVWCFLHTLAEKIKDEHFNIEGRQMITFIIRICKVLPCPECSQHASQFWGNVNVNGIRHREDLMNLIHIFHNIVNKRKNKEVFKKEQLSVYKHINLINAYNSFVSVYHTKGNMKLLGETFQRQMVLGQLKKWIQQNHHCFTK